MGDKGIHVFHKGVPLILIGNEQTRKISTELIFNRLKLTHKLISIDLNMSRCISNDGRSTNIETEA